MTTRGERWAGLLGVLVLSAAISCDIAEIDLLPVDNVPDEVDMTPEATGGEPSVELPDAGGQGGQGDEPVVEPPPPPPEVLMVVDEVPSSTDDTIEQHLVEYGAVVQRISELEVTLVDVSNFDLLVVTPSADRADFPGDLATTPVPMISLEPSVVAKLKLGAMQGGALSTEILIKSHPIVEGLEGTQKVCSSEVFIAGNDVLPSADLASSVPGMTPGVIFVYEEGSMINENPLPAARIGISLIKVAPCQTPMVWGIFDAAVSYALESR